MSITTSIVVSFAPGGGGGDILRAELADDLNEGKTTFSPGDDVYIAVYAKTSMVLAVSASAGSIAPQGNANESKVEQVNFPSTKNGSVAYPVNIITGQNWWGNDLGGLSVDQFTTRLLAALSGVAIAEVTYNTYARYFRLSGVDANLNAGDDFKVLIFVEGK